MKVWVKISRRAIQKISSFKALDELFGVTEFIDSYFLFFFVLWKIVITLSSPRMKFPMYESRLQ